MVLEILRGNGRTAISRDVIPSVDRLHKEPSYVCDFRSNELVREETHDKQADEHLLSVVNSQWKNDMACKLEAVLCGLNIGAPWQPLFQLLSTAARHAGTD